MKIDQMSIAGVGNAAAGAATVLLAKHYLTAEENRTATKKDVRAAEMRIIKLLERVKKENTHSTETFVLKPSSELPKLGDLNGVKLRSY